MAIAAATIITSVRKVLLDPAPGVTWTDADLLALITEAEHAICTLKREAYPVRGTINLVAGIRQTLPADGLAVMDLFNNVASGRNAVLVNRELMDAAAISYPAATPEVDVQEWCKDDRDPLRFNVIPPNDGTGAVVALYGAVPPAITTNINLLDIYEPIIKAFVIAQAYSQNTDRQDLAKYNAYTAEWKGLLGVTSQSQVAVSAKVGHQGGAS
jgi:hypothetical protein